MRLILFSSVVSPFREDERDALQIFSTAPLKKQNFGKK